MKGLAILLDVRDDGAACAALIRDGALADFRLAPPGGRPWGAEALAAARATRRLQTAEAGRGAQFFDLGEGERGYRAGAEARHSGRGPRVEFRVWPEGAKAWPLAARPTLRSRRLALTPGAPGVNLSRSIKGDETRAALRADVERGLGGAAGVGCVVRSVAAADPDGLEAETAWLLSRWRRCAAAADVGDPRLLQAAPGPAALALREWTGGAARPQILFTPRSVATPRGRGGEGAAPLWTALEPYLAPSDPIRSAIAESAPALFEQFDVIAQASAALEPLQRLDGGASFRVEATAALIAVDVDSGSAASASADAAAARALPRLLRIGGHGGLVAVDFLARETVSRQRVAALLSKALGGDPVETEILGWTAGGLLELRRKRARPRLTQAELTAWVEAEKPEITRPEEEQS